eukprot:10040-Pyramimonas_sp.AAC.1
MVWALLLGIVILAHLLWNRSTLNQRFVSGRNNHNHNNHHNNHNNNHPPHEQLPPQPPRRSLDTYVYTDELAARPAL